MHAPAARTAMMSRPPASPAASPGMFSPTPSPGGGGRKPPPLVHVAPHASPPHTPPLHPNPGGGLGLGLGWGWGGGPGGGYGGPPGPDGGGPPGPGDGGGGPPSLNLWLVDVDKFGSFDAGMVVKNEQQVGQGDPDTLQQQQHDQFTAVLPCVIPGAAGRVTIILPDPQKPSEGGWQSSPQACPANPSANTLEPVGVAAQAAAASGYGVGQWVGAHCCMGGYRTCRLSYGRPLGTPCSCSGEGIQFGIAAGYVCP